MTIPFKLVHVSARERLHACLRFRLVHVAENVQQRPLGSHISVGRRIRCNTGRGVLDTAAALTTPAASYFAGKPNQTKRTEYRAGERERERERERPRPFAGRGILNTRLLVLLPDYCYRQKK